MTSRPRPPSSDFAADTCNAVAAMRTMPPPPHSDELGPRHLLHAILDECPDSVCARALQHLGINQGTVRPDERTPPLRTEDRWPIFSLPLRHVFSVAAREAHSEDRLVLTDHLVAIAIRQQPAQLVQLILEQDLTEDKFRDAVEQHLP